MQSALHLGERLAALGLGLGRHQIGDPLCLGEIEAACLERAPGELAGIGGPQAGKCGKRIEERGEDGRAAVNVELRHVLSSGAARRREPEGKTAVDRLPRHRFAKAPQRSLARFRQRRAADPRERVTRTWA